MYYVQVFSSINSVDFIHKVIVAKELFYLFIKSDAKFVETKISSTKMHSVCYHGLILQNTFWPGNLFYASLKMLVWRIFLGKCLGFF